MKQSKTPLWKKSMLQKLNLYDIKEYLYEITDNGDPHGYEWGIGGYYNDYKDQFDELSAGAWALSQALEDYDVNENWDDMTVALLGPTHTVLGYDVAELDYFSLFSSYIEDWAVEEAVKRLERLTKRDLIITFRKVLATLLLFFDVKASHDCLTSIVEELDNRGALLEEKNNQINKLYEDLTGKDGEEFDRLIENLPQRMWVE